MMQIKGFLLFISLIYVMVKVDEPLRKSFGFPPAKGKEEKRIEPKVMGYTLKSNSFIRCSKVQPTDCGVTISDCINGLEKYDCIQESDLVILKEELK